MMKSLETCEVNETLGIFEKYFVKDEENFHEEAYNQVMNFLIDLLKEVNQKQKNFITKLKITYSPFKYLHKSLDFGLFYEYENEQL